jgi:hypothetical protein
MRSEIRKVRAVLMGDSELFQGLLVDVLRDLRVEVDVITEGRPDLVFAVVREADVSQVLGLAKKVAFGAPVVAVLPMRDDRLARAAILSGASNLCSLDGPIDVLRITFLQAIARRSQSATTP